MGNKNWSALKKLLDSPDFTKPPGFDTALLNLLKKATEGKAKEILSKADAKIVTLLWLKQLCSRFKIDAKGTAKAAYFKDALMKAYQEEKDNDLLEAIKKVDAEARERETLIEDFYDDLCKSTPTKMLTMLKEHFPDKDGVEDKLKGFRQKFGIRAGASKKTKLETRLTKIAEELTARRAVNGLR